MDFNAFSMAVKACSMFFQIFFNLGRNLNPLAGGGFGFHEVRLADLPHSPDKNLTPIIYFDVHFRRPGDDWKSLWSHKTSLAQRPPTFFRTSPAPGKAGGGGMG